MYQDAPIKDFGGIRIDHKHVKILEKTIKEIDATKENIF